MLWLSLAAKQREAAWRNLRNHVLPILEAGQSIYVHCAAGIHPTPFGCALLLSHLGVGTLDACLARIGKLRAIKVDEAVSRSPDMAAWAHEVADGPGRVELLCPLRIPVGFLAGQRKGMWHLESSASTAERPEPVCRFKVKRGKAESNWHAQLQGQTLRVPSVEEALVVGEDRPWCSKCLAYMPGGSLAALRASSVQYSQERS